MQKIRKKTQPKLEEQGNDRNKNRKMEKETYKTMKKRRK